MRGVVYRSTGSWYTVKDPAGKFHQARIKGIFKMDGITSTNPLAVGDAVEIEEENETGDTGIITAIHPRHNYISRQSPRHKHQHHIIAANIDQSLLFATLKEPRTSQGFIDRFLVAGEMYHVPSVIVFNKSDLYKKKELEKFEAWKAMYEKIGYQLMMISVMENQGVEELKSLLKDKCSLVSGHSGVGKSSFINLIIPEMLLKTREVSGWSGKGLHTTTFAEMFDLPFGGTLIDTPGLREFGLVDLEKQELSHYFPEMRKLINDCRFNNCEHINEPGCAIKEAVEQGRIHEDRYISYCNIHASLEQKGY
ncbi:MAG: ribosome small subunit-dependent GTPase A [Terrimonas sp.]|nr:ribosome small subunit-dependent GTPase A [Terrimonas sp.]